jgi:hypothetical protein
VTALVSEIRGRLVEPHGVSALSALDQADSPHGTKATNYLSTAAAFCDSRGARNQQHVSALSSERFRVGRRRAGLLPARYAAGAAWRRGVARSAGRSASRATGADHPIENVTWHETSKQDAEVATAAATGAAALLKARAARVSRRAAAAGNAFDFYPLHTRRHDPRTGTNDRKKVS